MDERVAAADRVASRLRAYERAIERLLLTEGALPEGTGSERFARLPEAASLEGLLPEEAAALHHLYRHTIPVPSDWDYFLWVEADEWAATLQSQSRRYVSRRYLEKNEFFLKGCHRVEGDGGLEWVLKRASGTPTGQGLVLKIDISLVREKFQIPVMAEPMADPPSVHPHIFGPLPLEAVVATAPLKITVGSFSPVVSPGVGDHDASLAALIQEMESRVAEAQVVSERLTPLQRELERSLQHRAVDATASPFDLVKAAAAVLGEVSAVEAQALEVLSKHTVHVPSDWNYFMWVERAEWEAALRAPSKRFVSKRYLANNEHCLRGCHQIQGDGGTEWVLRRADGRRLEDSVVLKVDLHVLRDRFQLPIMAESMLEPASVHPHIFGPLPVEAVVATAPLKLTAGEFVAFS